MYPVSYALSAAGGLVLGDFALVVREHQVHSAAVDVEFIAEVLCSHDRAFEMPSRETFAPRRRPSHNMLRFSLFPECKVVWRMLVALSVQSSGSFQSVIQSSS